MKHKEIFLNTKRDGMTNATNPDEILYIQVDGIIGAGKTHFISSLEEFYQKKGIKYVVVREPVDLWEGEGGILQSFYKDSKRWCYTFQTTAFIDRIVALQDGFKRAEEEGAAIIISERGPMTDNIFFKINQDLGNADELESRLYKKWSEKWRELIVREPDYIFFIDTDIETTMKRIKSRSRFGEDNISLDYQTKLREEHENYLCDKTRHNGKIMRINYNINIDKGDTLDKYFSITLIDSKLPVLELKNVEIQ